MSYVRHNEYIFCKQKDADWTLLSYIVYPIVTKLLQYVLMGDDEERRYSMRYTSCQDPRQWNENLDTSVTYVYSN